MTVIHFKMTAELLTAAPTSTEQPSNAATISCEAKLHSGGKGGPRKGGGAEKPRSREAEFPERSREAEKPNSPSEAEKPRSREAEFPERSREAEKPRSRIPRAKPRSREAEKPNSPGEAEKPRMRTCPSLLPYILCTCPNMSCDSTHCTHVQTSDVIRVQSAIM